MVGSPHSGPRHPAAQLQRATVARPGPSWVAQVPWRPQPGRHGPAATDTRAVVAWLLQRLARPCAGALVYILYRYQGSNQGMNNMSSQIIGMLAAHGSFKITHILLFEETT